MGEPIKREEGNVKIFKLNESDDKIDIQNDTDEISEDLPSGMASTKREIFSKLIEVRKKVYKYKVSDLSKDTTVNNS